MTRGSIALVAAALVAHALAAAHAAPLDKDECAKLKGEQALLEQGGVRGSMGRGPEWAKANLSADKLEQVRRIIEIDEQLLFRCQGKSLVNLKEVPDPDPAASTGKAAPKVPAAKAPAAKAPAAKAPAAKAPVKKAPAQPAVKEAPKPPAKKAAMQPAAGAVKEAPKAPGAAKAPAGPVPASPAGDAPANTAEPAREAKAKPKRKTNDANSSGNWVVNPFADMLAPAKK